MRTWIRKNREKLVIFGLGVVFIIVALEAALRIIGYGEIESPLFYKKVYQKGPNDYVILCIGDSFTAGGETPPDKSYPRQLEELLKKKIKNKIFYVYNRAMAAYNTAQILSELDRNIQATNPDLVILLAGGSNLWNAWGCRGYSGKRSLLFKMQDVIYRIRLFKLVKLISIDVQNKLKKQRTDSFDIALSSNFLTKEQFSYSKDYQDKAKSYEEKGMYKEAAEYYGKALEIDSKNCGLYAYLGQLYCNQLNNREEGIKMLERAIELEPNGNFGHYMALDNAYRGHDDKFIKGNDDKFAQFLNRVSAVSATARDFQKMALSRKEFQNSVRQWITLDVKEILDICSRNGAKLMLQDYPVSEKYEATLMDDINLIIAEVAEKYSLLFVENDSVFNKLFLNGAESQDYFMPGAHPNIIGYGIMARNIYNKMVQEKLVAAN